MHCIMVAPGAAVEGWTGGVRASGGSEEPLPPAVPPPDAIHRHVINTPVKNHLRRENREEEGIRTAPDTR